MTKKRFSISSESNQNIWDNEKKCYYSSIDAIQLCELLNELKQEAKDNEHYHTVVLENYKAISKENEQLKIQIDDVNNESIGYEEQIEKLLKKNEQLKAQLQRYEIDFKQFEKECQECEKGILRIIDDKIQSARELGTVKTVIVLKNLRKEIIKCKD